VLVVAIGLGSGAYILIVKPLAPPTRDLKLITRYVSLEVLQKMGVADNIIVPDDEIESRKTNDEENKAKDGLKEKTKVPKGADNPNDEPDDSKKKPQSLDSSRNAFFRAINYLFSKSGWWILPLSIAFAIIFSIMFKLYRRKRWFDKQKLLVPDEQVKSMYSFYMKKLRKMKIKKPIEDTLFEFIETQADVLSRFSTQSVKFSDLTGIYSGIIYGGEVATKEDAEAFNVFYDDFYYRIKDYLGGVKYAIKFFVL
jgi:hypothetical protein